MRKSLLLTLTFLIVFWGIANSQSQAQLDSLERLIDKKSGKEKIQLLNDLTFYYNQTNAKKAIGFGEKSMILAKELNDPFMLANTNNDLSMAYMTLSNYEKAIVLNQNALAIRLKIKDTTGIISSYSKLGVCYYELGKYAKAQESYNKAIRLAKKTNNVDGLIKLYQNSANILEITGAVEEALQMQKDVQEIALQTENTEVMITSLGNMANCYRQLKQYDKARDAYNRANQLIGPKQNQDLKAIVYQGLGVMERELGNNELGLNYYKKTFQIYKKMDTALGLSSISGNIAAVYIEMNQPDSAMVYLKIGLEKSKETKSYKQIATLYHQIGTLCYSTSKFKESATYFRLEADYKDSVLLHSSGEVMAEMYTKYEVEKKERELAENKVQIAENKFKNLVLTVASIGLGVLLLIIFLFFRRKRKQAKLELERAMKEEQILRERKLNEQKMEISRELHDNIGSQITYMISSMDNLAYVEEGNEQVLTGIQNISEFGRETMKNLRSTIWAMNSEDGSIKVLLRKLEDLRAHIPIDLEIKNGLEKDPELKSLEMLNLYRIAQEAIQNSLKYSNATKLFVEVRLENGVICLEISDNGRGFDKEVNVNGNGLANMEYRCNQIKAEFQLETSIHTGTKIRCLLRHLSY